MPMREFNCDLLGVHYFPHLLPPYRRLAIIAALTPNRDRTRSAGEFNKEACLNEQAPIKASRYSRKAMETVARLAG